MDRFEVFRLYGVPGEVVGVGQMVGDLPHHVLDEHRAAIGLLRDVLLVLALEDRVDRRGRAGLDQVDDVLDPDELGEAEGDADLAALVVRPDLAISSEQGHRVVIGTVISTTRSTTPPSIEPLKLQRYSISPRAGDGRLLVEEVGEGHFEVRDSAGRRAVSARIAPIVCRLISAVFVEDFDEPAHVGPLEAMGQVDVHVHAGDRALGALDLVQTRTGYEMFLTPTLSMSMVWGLTWFWTSAIRSRAV